jgi:hypothetical protein
MMVTQSVRDELGSILDHIEEWLGTPFKEHQVNDRRWFNNPIAEIYLRKMEHNNWRRIDLANITFTFRKTSGQRYTFFLGWLMEVGQRHGYHEIIVENVMDLRFQSFHDSLAYTTKIEGTPPSYSIRLSR